MLESEKIDKLFERMAIRYGSLWLAKYEGLEWGDVRLDWARCLDGCPSFALNFGVVNLPIDHVPNAGEFRAICNRAPAPPEPARLSHRLTDEDRVRSKAVRQFITDRLAKVHAEFPPETWKERQIALFEAMKLSGKPLSIAQSDWLNAAKASMLAPTEASSPTFTNDQLNILKAKTTYRVQAYAAEKGIPL